MFCVCEIVYISLGKRAIRGRYLNQAQSVGLCFITITKRKTLSLLIHSADKYILTIYR